MDFDGVIKPLGYKEEVFMPERIQTLAEFIDKTDVSIVISSSWREDHTLVELKAYFPENIRTQIVGVTPKFETSYRGSRYEEIMQYLKVENIINKPWLAIDDDRFIFIDEVIDRNVLLTDPLIGFDEAMLTKALQMSFLLQHS